MVIDAAGLGVLTQLGAAGLIGWMWLTERRAAAEREKQLTEAHRLIASQRVELDALLEAIRENTRALAALEAGQRRLITAVERIGAAGDRQGARAG
ncbi:MAG: hypothetical protein AAGB51_13280 [Planctomycetota bacterium]